MAATVFAAASVVVFVLFHYASRGKPLHHDFASKAALVDGEMVDVVGNMALVKAFCGLRREHSRFDKTVQHELHARRMSLFYLERLRFVHALITVGLTLGLLAWALSLWQQGRASPGDVVMVCTLGLSVLSATRDLAVAMVDVTQHLARLSEAILTLLVPHQLRDHPEAVPLVHRGADITFKNVSFGYPSGSQVFSNLDLRIRSGERVGLVGPSGAGKSTLLTLLHRFYEVDQGEVLIDGQRINRITQDSLWNAIATVPQDTALFNRSLLENIRYGRPDASDDDVWRAAMAARCDTFIEELPEGLKTIVGDRGLRLSGGQRQRISIARAFLKNAPILLLDEATSALDTDLGRSHSRRAGATDGRPHRHRHRTPAVDAAQVRSHRRHQGRRGGRGRLALSPDQERWTLQRLDSEGSEAAVDPRRLTFSCRPSASPQRPLQNRSARRRRRRA